MKPVKMMMLDSCPYCQQALNMIETLKQKNPRFQAVSIELIEESREPEKTQGYDYWYVPTFFVGGDKLHEGVPTLEKVEAVLDAALS